MAFLLSKKNPISSHFRSQSQAEDAVSLSRRGFHVEPAAREKALLAADPAIDRFKSYKKSVYKIKRVGDVLMIVAVAGCCYEICVRATLREEARSKARESA